MSEWKGLSPQIPDVLEQTRDQVSSFFEILITILEIVLVVLSIIKVFAVGLLNPLVVLLDVIIEFVEGLLLDIRQVGIYLHGDFVYFEGDSNLDTFINKTKGGYFAYEQRMVDRLLNRNDPNRPDLSSSSTVISLFFYSSTNAQQIIDLIKFIRALMELFNRETNVPIPVPDRPEVNLKYSTSALITSTVNMFSDDYESVPDIVEVSWEMLQTGSPTGFNLSPLYPDRFLIEISTIPTGILVANTKEINSSTGTENGAPEFVSSFYQDTINKGSLRIFGGKSRILLQNNSGWNGAINGTSFKSGATPIFGIKSPKESNIIPFELLEDNDLGVSYIVENFAVTNKPSFELDIDKLPYHVEFEKDEDGTYKVLEGSRHRPRTFYIRVSTCSSEVEGVEDVQFVLDDPNNDGPLRATLKKGFQMGRVSQTQKISLPSPNAIVYIKSLQTALAILVLTRCDIEIDSENYPDLYDKFASINASNNAKVKSIMAEFFFDLKDTAKTTTNCFDYRQNLLERVQSISTLMFDRMGDLSESIYDLAADTQEDLLNKKIFDNKTLLQLLKAFSVQEGATVTGIQKNTYSQGTLDEPEWLTFPILKIEPIFQETSSLLAIFNENPPGASGLQRQDTISKSPRSASYFLDTLEPETIAAVSKILQLTPATFVDGEWIAIRLFPEGLTPVEQFLETVIKNLKSIREGLKGIIKAIEEFIQFFEIRILQLQQILRQIEAILLKLLQMLQLIPASSFLLNFSAGTDGVVSDLVTSQNKPSDSNSYHSAGIVALGGGVPTLVVDLIQKLFEGGG